MGLNFYLCPDEKTDQDSEICSTILALRCFKYPVKYSLNSFLAGIFHLVHPGAEYALSEGEGTARGSRNGLDTSAFIQRTYKDAFL